MAAILSRPQRVKRQRCIRETEHMYQRVLKQKHKHHKDVGNDFRLTTVAAIKATDKQCAPKYIASDNGLAPNRRQAIIGTNVY